MPALAGWTHTGAIQLTGDLSILESELHAGRVAAAELGYSGEPDSIEVSEAMLQPGQPGFISAEDAAVAGQIFRATHTRFIMTWQPQG